MSDEPFNVGAAPPLSRELFDSTLKIAYILTIIQVIFIKNLKEMFYFFLFILILKKAVWKCVYDDKRCLLIRPLIKERCQPRLKVTFIINF